MEKNAKIDLINEIKQVADKHPTTKHGQDHEDLWNAIKLCVSAMKQIYKELEDLSKVDDDIKVALNRQSEILQEHNRDINSVESKARSLYTDLSSMKNKYPKIITMKKTSLIMDGDNIIDTVEIESGRYLMVTSINPVDWNEYAKIDDLLTWNTIEVTDGKYDVNINLKTKDEWQTATMTVNIDLLFIKY